jgi:hypothetical protein
LKEEIMNDDNVAGAVFGVAVGTIAIFGAVLFAPVVLPLALACVALEDSDKKKK